MLKLLTKFEAFNHIRRRAVLASVMIFFAAAAIAQSRRTEHKGPRGIAVVEFVHAPAADRPPSGPAKLWPVTIYYNGNYYDASLYEATPEPMAVQTGTVYEVQRDGEALGLFTTTMPRRDADSWYAVGNWQVNAPESATTASAKKSGAFVNPASNDERPILKRGSSQSSSPSSGETPNSSSSPSSGDEERPVLKRPQQSSATASPSPESTQPEAPGATSPAYGAEAQDPNRPVLRRGKPRAQSEEPAAMTNSSAHPVASKPEATRMGQPQVSPASQPESAAMAFVGVSDTETSDERPYRYPWTKEQQAKLTAQMSKLALQKAREYEQQRKLSGASWEESSVRAYDLFTNNDGELIFSGTQSVAGPRTRKVYVTFAALYDASGELEPLFSDVTDSEQLDVKGRLELIDAVDSTGDGRGDLLFRRIGISSQKFELYRVTSNELYKLFEGAVAPI